MILTIICPTCDVAERIEGLQTSAFFRATAPAQHGRIQVVCLSCETVFSVGFKGETRG